jgi:apolipoprotein D and lipocalin family protein
MRRLLPLPVLLAAALAASPVVAAAPQPAKTLEIDRFLGRWHEIARTPNFNQRGCQAGTADWGRSADGALTVVQRCVRAKGEPKTWSGSATIVDPATNAKLRLSLMKGLIKQEYWVLDRADDYSWAIAGTPGGNFVWILARKPDLSASERTAVLSRVKALGYDTGKLEFPRG